MNAQLFGRLSCRIRVMYVGHDCSQFVQECVVTVHLWQSIILGKTSLGLDGNTNLLQKFHILPTHASLTEFEKAVGGGGIVQDDLKYLGAEEVSQSASASVEGTMLLGSGVGGGRRIVIP